MSSECNLSDMGPIIIFDKSFLESINPDESVWLDNFYLSNITPLFFIETLADLEKEIRKGRTPEDVVGSIAYRTPEQGRPNIHHKTLLEAELRGIYDVDMEFGRPHISEGKTYELGGNFGAVFSESQEEEALRRWQKGEFLSLERLTAKKWRQQLSNVDFEQSYKFFQKFFPIGKPRTLEDVKRIVDFYIDDFDQERVLIFGLSLEGVSSEFQGEILNRWKDLNKPKIRNFVPYFSHVFSVDFFFYLAISADLIGRGRPSHIVDLAYLYYLPFCMVFTSNDKLHANIAPLFLRDNQTFISGAELKSDLRSLNGYYEAFSGEIEERGVMNFAIYPPEDSKFLITRLWDRHMDPDWRGKTSAPPRLDDAESGVINEIHRFERDGRLISAEAPISSDDLHSVILERKMSPRKGRWNIFPKSLIES